MLLSRTHKKLNQGVTRAKTVNTRFGNHYIRRIKSGIVFSDGSVTEQTRIPERGDPVYRGTVLLSRFKKIHRVRMDLGAVRRIPGFVESDQRYYADTPYRHSQNHSAGFGLFHGRRTCPGDHPAS